jgi:hypothetical protein
MYCGRHPLCRDEVRQVRRAVPGQLTPSTAVVAADGTEKIGFASM